MKNTNLDKTIVFIDKKAEYEGKNRTYKLRLNELKGKNKIIGYQKHKKNKAHEAKKQKLLNSKLYKFRKRIIGTLVLVLSILVILFLCNNMNIGAQNGVGSFNYKMKRDDIIIHQADEYVHAYLDDGYTRFPETVDVFVPDEKANSAKEKYAQRSYSYTVRRGKSLLYDAIISS